ncbi:CPBP family intramembrane glutamic endopeptidase [Gudongella sp. DL1XJH-153]|uniref:CPBP family intramembrane glutamic endopeptidase n=1 Tax=Gudongella sp. DL1XJH-153 TaxID=3409804 RepID=UPI003BB7E38C
MINNRDYNSRNKDRGSGIILFLSITYFLSWLLWLPALLNVYEIDVSLPEQLFVRIGNFMPSILGLIFIFSVEGRAGLSKLTNQLTKVKFSFPWYMFALFLMPAIMIASYLIAYVTVGLEFESILLPVIYPEVWQVIPLVVFFVIAQGPAGEEIGWRGYVLPRLLQRYEPIKAGIVMGMIWAVWHLPKFFIVDSTQYSLTDAYGIPLALAGYTMYTVMLSIMITLLYIKTGKSILAVLLFHAMANFSHGMVTILTNTAGGISIILMMFLFTVLIVYHFKKNWAI